MSVRQGCVFSPDLFNRYSEAIVRELEVVPGFVIGGHNLNSIRYADVTVLIADTERTLQKLLRKLVKKSKRKGLNINYKKTEYMFISKRNSRTCKLYMLENPITDEEKT